MSYPYLPGLLVKTNDGGIESVRTPEAKSVVVIGTAGQGQADSLYAVSDRAEATKEFGFAGSLTRGMQELAQGGCDNIYLYRMGSVAGSLTAVGKSVAPDPVAAGFSLVFGDRTATTGTDYKVYYADGVLYVFKNGTIVYANDTGVQEIDTGDVDVSIPDGVAPTAGTDIGTAPTWAAAVAVKDVLIAAGTWAAPVLGTSLNKRELYVAIDRAMRDLSASPIEEVIVPDAVLDCANVAFNDSTTSTDTLDWLKTWEDTTGRVVYHWASETNDSTGSVVAAHAAWANAEARIADGYHEVNFGYQLARFCHKQEQIQMGQGVCLGFIGMKAPKDFKQSTVRLWIGRLPEYDSQGAVTASGKGLLGNPYMAGTTADKLHNLCHDKTNPGYRTKGFFANSGGWDGDGEYDCGAETDDNQRPVDIGAYLHVLGDWATVSNGYSAAYTASIANVVAGFVSMLDEKSSTTNKELVGVIQKHRPNLAQLNDFTRIGINMLRFRGVGSQPRLTHGQTAATRNSDFDSLVRQRVKGLVVKRLANKAEPFIGEANTDGLQLTSLKTVLDSEMQDLKKRGYIGVNHNIVIFADRAMQKLGHARIRITFTAPDELNQLEAVVGVQGH